MGTPTHSGTKRPQVNLIWGQHWHRLPLISAVHLCLVAQTEPALQQLLRREGQRKAKTPTGFHGNAGNQMAYSVRPKPSGLQLDQGTRAPESGLIMFYLFSLQKPAAGMNRRSHEKCLEAFGFKGMDFTAREVSVVKPDRNTKMDAEQRNLQVTQNRGPPFKPIARVVLRQAFKHHVLGLHERATRV